VKKNYSFYHHKPEEIVIDLHQINHTFLPGHKMMIQVQSTWFPIIDRNPRLYQTFLKQKKVILSKQLKRFIALISWLLI